MAADAIQAVLTSPDYLWSTFSALPAGDLVTACRVCRQWRRVEHEHEERLWAALCSKLVQRIGKEASKSRRLASLPAKRRFRILDANRRVNYPDMDEAFRVLTAEYKFEIELNGDGPTDEPEKTYCGVAVPGQSDFADGVVSLRCPSNDVADVNSGWAFNDEEHTQATLRVFVMRRRDNKMALLMSVPFEGIHSEEGHISGTGFRAEHSRSFLPGSVVALVETSWQVELHARASEAAKLSDIDLAFYCKPGGSRVEHLTEDMDAVEITAEELVMLLKNIDWA